MGFLMPKLPTVRIEGSRLADLAITSSAYGETISLGFGTIRLAGNIFWGQEIREEKVVSKSTSGGKGGGGQKTITTEYFYFSDIAIGFASGPADKVLRQWGDGKTYFDIRAGQDQTRMNDLVFRFYRGTEEQDPDPLILSVEGVDNTPAYRGIVYIVLEDFPLADFGNRLPNLTVEINFEQGQSETLLITAGADDAGITGPGYGKSLIDWQRGYLYMPVLQVDPSTAFLKYSLSTLEFIELLEVGALTGGTGLEIFALDPRTGYMVGSHTSLDYRNYVWDPASNTLITDREHADGQQVYKEDEIAVIFTLTSDVGTFSAVISGNVIEQHVHNFPDLDYITSFTGPEPGRFDQDGAGPQLWWNPGWRVAGGNGEAWGFWKSVDELRFMKYNLDPSGQVTETHVDTILNTDLDPLEDFTHLSSRPAPIYDPTSGAIYVVVEMTGPTFYVIKWTPESGLIWSSSIPFSEETFGFMRTFHRLSGERLILATATDFLQSVNLVTGEVEQIEIGELLEFGAQVWDDQRNCLYDLYTNATTWQTLRRICPTGQAPQSTDLASVIERVSIRAGLDPILDVDASAAIAVEVLGYEISNESDGASALEGLMELHSYTVAEYDGIIKFIARGGAVGGTIDQDDMIVNPKRKGFNPYEEEIEEEIDLPERFTVEFQNRALDYQTDIRGTTRVLTPDPTVFTTNTFELDLPVVLDPTVAKQKSEILLYQAWIEAVQYKAQVPFKNLALAPGDPITLSFANGLFVRARTERADLGNDFSIKARFRSESTGQYSSSAFTESGAAQGQSVKQVGPSKLFLWGGPLLRDVDATNRTNTRTYFGGAPLGLLAGEWPGMRLLQSIDSGASYDLWGTNLVSCPWGTAKNALADPVSWNLTDTVNFLDVAMVEGAARLESVTALDVANNRNSAILFKRDGGHEYFQFQTVTPQGGNVYRLSILARGRRGTEAMAYQGHDVGEEFMLIDPAALEGNLQSLASIAAARLYKPVTLGALEELTTVFTFADQGRDLMPYEPVHILATIDGIDIDWTWKRRTRVGGALRDFVDVPLSEASESYELDIFASQGATTALRTLVSATEAVTYTDAQITADFGSIPATIWIELYQLSAEVGRGFARRLEITVL